MCTYEGPYRERGRPVPGHPAAAHPRRHRRHRRGAHHLAARGLRRRAQLGLPVLLAARRVADPRGAAGVRLRRRGEAVAQWLLRAVAGDPKDLQIMYGVDGGRDLPEQTLDHLPGYAGSTPVRIGNGAVRPAADRRARRGDDRPGDGPRRRRRRRRGLLVAAAGADRGAGRALGRARQRAVGDPRSAAAVHPLPGDGLGGLRPGDPGGRAARPRRTGRAVARRCGTRCTPR